MLTYNVQCKSTQRFLLCYHLQNIHPTFCDFFKWQSFIWNIKIKKTWIILILLCQCNLLCILFPCWTNKLFIDCVWFLPIPINHFIGNLTFCDWILINIKLFVFTAHSTQISHYMLSCHVILFAMCVMFWLAAAYHKGKTTACRQVSMEDRSPQLLRGTGNFIPITSKTHIIYRIRPN